MQRWCESRVGPFVVAGVVASWLVAMPTTVVLVVGHLAAVGLVAAVLLLRRRVTHQPVRRWLGVASTGAFLLLVDDVVATAAMLLGRVPELGGLGTVAGAAGYVAIAAGVFGLLATLVGDDWVDLVVEVGVVAALSGVVAWLALLQFHAAEGLEVRDLLALTTLAASAARVAVSLRLSRCAPGSHPLRVIASGWMVWFVGDVLLALGGTAGDWGHGLIVAATGLVVLGLLEPSIADDVFSRPLRLELRPGHRRWLLVGAVALVPLAVQVAAVVGTIDRIVLTGAVVLVGAALVLRVERARILELRARAGREEALEDALTAQRQVDEELRRLATTRNLFLRAISHQLRTPLTSIVGFARTLDRHGDELAPAMAADLRRRILHNGERLELVVDALCDLDLLSRGMITPTDHLVDLAPVVRAAIDDVELGMRAIVVDLRSTQVIADAALLGRAVRRLLDNAVKHTPEGTTITVRVREELGHAHVTVADDGPGVPPGLHERLFEPLVQGPAAATDPNPGVGLGLALVSHIARLHGGQAWADDTPDGGAQFHLLLPATGRQRRRVEDRPALQVETPDAR